MSQNTNIFLSTTAIETTTIVSPPVDIKGETTVNYVLTGIKEGSTNVLFLEVDWGDGTPLETFKRDVVFNYEKQSIFDEILYGRLGGSVCVQKSHLFSNQTDAFCLKLYPQFTLTYNDGNIVTFKEQLNVYHGSFYDDIENLTALNAQILPTSDNTTFVNFESKVGIQVIPSILEREGNIQYFYPQSNNIVPFNLEWVTTVGEAGAICNPEPWIISNNNTAIRYNIVDSLGCGGTCDEIQSGTATATITTGSQKDVLMYVNVEGIGELQETGYENIKFSLNDVLVLCGTSTGGNLGCASGPIISTVIVPGPYLLPRNTTNTFFIDFTTYDELYHVDCYYQINLSFEEIS